jgi:MFS family permease
MTTVQALVTMASLTVSIYAPQAARDIGVGPEYIGVYASLTYVGAMLGSLLAGGFVLRYGAIRFSQGAMVLCAVGLLFCVGAHWWWFLLSAFVLGFGYGPMTPASSHILSRHTPVRSLSLVFSIKQTGVPLGGVLAGLLVPLLLIHYDWRVVSVIVALTVIFGALCLQGWRRRFDTEVSPSQPLLRGNVLGPLRLIFSRPDLRLIALATFFFSATQQCYIYFLVTYFEVDIGWSTQQAGFALSVLGGSAVLARMVWGAIADASGQSRRILGIIALGMAGATAVTASFSVAWPVWSIFAVCAVFGATGAAWNGVYLAEISRHVGPEDVGRATGGALFVTFAGVVVGPPLFGLAIDFSGGFTAGYVTLATVTAVVGL